MVSHASIVFLHTSELPLYPELRELVGGHQVLVYKPDQLRGFTTVLREVLVTMSK